MKIALWIARLVVGITFVFSGFVKLIDPLGSAYKFEEYFAEGVLDLPFLIPYALIFSIVLILFELLLGVAIIIGFKPVWTSASLVILTGVFLFLTWYSAYYDKVTDCGCFGDAITLTPWETFYKNIVLIVLVLFLWWKRYDILPILQLTYERWVMLASTFAALYITYYVLVHLPIIDFRPYAIGENLSESMMEFDENGIPKVHDFYLESETDDLTDQILNEDKALLLISYDIFKSEEGAWTKLESVFSEAKTLGYSIYAVTASSDQEINDVKRRFDLEDIPFLFCDATTLKTIIRANPGLVVLQKGTVIDKRNVKDYSRLKLE